MKGSRLGMHVALLAVCLVVTSASELGVKNEIECYLCSSDLDPYCTDSPSTTTTCSTTHGKGCATRLLTDGVIERGCSSIGLSPDGCRVSEFYGTECICHSEKCNTGIAVEKSDISTDNSNIHCYQCDSQKDATCSHDISESTTTSTCPAQNGCYLMKRVDEEGLILYHRLCFENRGPATYYPGGCYTVFNEQTSTSSDVCVCYTDKCNKNIYTSMESGKVDKSEQVLNAGCHFTNHIMLLLLPAVALVIL